MFDKLNPKVAQIQGWLMPLLAISVFLSNDIILPKDVSFFFAKQVRPTKLWLPHCYNET